MTKNEFTSENIFENLKDFLILIVSLSKDVLFNKFREKARKFIENENKSSIEILEIKKIEYFFDVNKNLLFYDNSNLLEIYANIVSIDNYI